MSDYADERPSYNLSARILTTSILSLAFVVLLLIVLHLYARCILNRSITGNDPHAQISLFRVASNHQIAPQTPNGLNQSTIDSLFRAASNHQIAPQTPNGLNQSTIDSLPTFSYRNKDQTMVECTICLSSVDDEEMVRVLPKCKHLFHVGCIDMWLHSHSTCPVCRARVEPIYSLGELGLVSRVGSSLRRLMSRDRSGRRMPEEGLEDLERQ